MLLAVLGSAHHTSDNAKLLVVGVELLHVGHLMLLLLLEHTTKHLAVVVEHQFGVVALKTGPRLVYSRWVCL